MSADAGATVTWTGGGATANWSDPNNWQSAAPPSAGDTIVFPAYSGTITSSVDDIAALSVATVEVDDGYNLSATGGATLEITSALWLANQHSSPPVPFAIPVTSSSSQLTIYATGGVGSYPVASTIADPTGSVRLSGATLEFISGSISATAVACEYSFVTFDPGFSLGSAKVSVTSGRLTVGPNMTLPKSVSLLGSATLALGDGATVAGPLALSGSGNAIVAGANSAVSGKIKGHAPLAVQVGAGGDFTLSGANTFTGGLSVTTAGMASNIVAKNQHAFGSGPVSVQGPGGVLLDAGSTTWKNRLTFGQAYYQPPGILHVVDAAAVTWAGPIAFLNGTPTIGALSPTGTLTLTGTISGAGAANVDGSGTVVIAAPFAHAAQASSTVTGPAQLVLAAPAGSVAWDADTLTLRSGATLQMAPGSDDQLAVNELIVDGSTLDIGPTAQTLAWGLRILSPYSTLIGTGTLTTPSIEDDNPNPTTSAATTDDVDFGSVVLSGGSPSISTNAAYLVINAVLEGTSGVVVSSQQTTGSIDFVANNTYTGTTFVGCLLYVDGYQPQSSINLSYGSGSLGGSGGTVGAITAPGTATSVTPDGIVQAASLTLGGTFSTFLYGTTPGAGYGQIVSAGTVELDNAGLSLGLPSPLQDGDSFTIIANHSGSGVVGTFAGLPEGQLFQIGNYVMSVTYHGGAGNDVVLTVIGPLGVSYGTWQSLGGGIIGKPAAAADGTGRVAAVVVAPDHSLWTRSLSGGHWSAWTGLGGYTSSDPALASWGPGRLDLFVRGADNALWHRSSTNGAWSGWERIEGALYSAPSVTSDAPNRLDVVVKGGDNNLWRLHYDGYRWLGWYPLPAGAVTSAPALASSGPNLIDAVVAMAGGEMMYSQFRYGTWSSWEDIAGRSSFDPAIASPQSGSLEVAAVTDDGAVWHQGYEGYWLGWSSLGGQASSAPALSSWGAGDAEIFVQGADGGLWYALGTASQPPAARATSAMNAQPSRDPWQRRVSDRSAQRHDPHPIRHGLP